MSGVGVLCTPGQERASETCGTFRWSFEAFIGITVTVTVTVITVTVITVTWSGQGKSEHPPRCGGSRANVAHNRSCAAERLPGTYDYTNPTLYMPLWGCEASAAIQ